MKDKSKSAYGSNKASDTDFRRKWDKQEYEAKAHERDRKDREHAIEKSQSHDKKKRKRDENVPEPTEKLKARDKEVVEKTLTQNLYKTQLVSFSTDRTKQPGFPCKECNRIFKDSIAYLDHINSRQHQRRIGVSMKVERSSAQDVQNRLQTLKTEMQTQTANTSQTYDIESKVKKINEEENERRKSKKKKKQKTKQENSDEEKIQEGEEEMLKMMGFTGFASTKI